MMITATAMLTVIGIFNIYSTTSPRLVLRAADPFYFTQRQALFVIVAAFSMFAVMFFGHDWLRSKALWLYSITTFSLVILLLWGRASGETKLSFDLGPIAVQPAEVMKPVLVLVLAAWFADAGLRTLPYDEFVRALLIAGLPFLLIALQPDLGSAMTIAGVRRDAHRRNPTKALRGHHRAGDRKLHCQHLVRCGSRLSVGAFHRVVEPEQHHQREPAEPRPSGAVRKACRCGGGILRKGLPAGELTNGRFIPVQSTDFPFSAIGEQFGLVGAIVVVSLFAFILLRVWIIGRNANTPFGRFLAAGVFATLAWQVFQNIGMTIGITPVSGLPLPFVSYGGSHLVAWAIMIGLVQSVEMRRSA